MREMVGSKDGHEVVALARDGQEAIQMAMQLVPHLAFISHDLPGISGLQTCETLSALAPDIMLVLISDSKSQSRMENAMRAGARALITKPLDGSHLSALIDELAAARQRRESSEVLEWKDPSGYPKVISVTGAKGGVGKTTVAVNLAVLLAKRLPNKVALIDLYAQFGDVATMMNITPKHTVAELAPICDELDADLLQTYITKHRSGVHVLVASVKPVPLDAVTAKCLDNLLYTLKRSYRYVIIDLPPMLHESTLHVLAHSNTILLIANLFELTTATDSKRFFDALQQEHISKDNIGVVLNRVSKANRLNTADVQRMLDCGILAEIPNDRRLVTAVNQGVPFVLNDGDSPVARSFEVLAEAVAESSGYSTNRDGSVAESRDLRRRR